MGVDDDVIGDDVMGDDIMVVVALEGVRGGVDMFWVNCERGAVVGVEGGVCGDEEARCVLCMGRDR